MILKDRLIKLLADLKDEIESRRLEARNENNSAEGDAEECGYISALTDMQTKLAEILAEDEREPEHVFLALQPVFCPDGLWRIERPDGEYIRCSNRGVFKTESAAVCRAMVEFSEATKYVEPALPETQRVPLDDIDQAVLTKLAGARRQRQKKMRIGQAKAIAEKHGVAWGIKAGFHDIICE